MGNVVIDTYLPAAIGVFVGGVFTVVFLLRTKAFSNGQVNSQLAGGQQRLSVRIVIGFYAAVAYIALVIALAIGDFVFIIFSGFMAIVATAALLRLWSGR